MSLLEAFFWLCLTIVAYTYFLYPILLLVVNRLFGADWQKGPVQASVSILIPVHNEEANLARRLEELMHMISRAGITGEIIVISDGSTDRSAEIARQFAEHGVRVLELTPKQGKAVALNAGAESARHDLLIFADARQRWADDALVRLIENFADANVGAVSGDLVLETAPGVLGGVSMYWRFEKWLRKNESRLRSQVGVTGAICAVRRSLFRSIPPGTVLDDVYWPIMVALQGYRVVHDERARAYDRLPANPQDEFRRKVRTLAGNFQLLTLLPLSAFVPGLNRIWWQWMSHKVLRLVAPWALIGMFVSCFFLAGDGFRVFFWLQAAGYGIGVLGLVPVIGESVKPLGWGASFLVLNAAAWLAFWVWITGRAGKSWHKAEYQELTIDN